MVKGRSSIEAFLWPELPLHLELLDLDVVAMQLLHKIIAQILCRLEANLDDFRHEPLIVDDRVDSGVDDFTG